MKTKQAVNVALGVIGRNGMSGVVCEATSLPTALKVAGLGNLTHDTLDRVAAELRRQGLLEISKRDKKHLLLQLSVKGIHRLQRSEIGAVTIPEPTLWDKKWRMVTYDIPATYSIKRRLFTTELRRLGFAMVRESVWFHPHPCFDQLDELVRYCGIVPYVTFAEISRLDKTTLEKLKRHYPEI
ncbi:hypothetical protein EOL73_01150 [Candidatus Saccharibacteria bacterium]|nr:hypothetical protein [Candidatus Saccharibacteria bacterium]NCU40349.1 hypothetical protein [Candidatus Saccharibacteria bacterium]